ncbi:entericidin EcnAB [Pseudorhodobacter aquimaris]|nr:entericidin EcnAB [Pseudorhodobacter aquimaris]
MRSPMIILPTLALMLLTACETVKGVGRDVGNTGEVITESSRQVQQDL